MNLCPVWEGKDAVIKTEFSGIKIEVSGHHVELPNLIRNNGLTPVLRWGKLGAGYTLLRATVVRVRRWTCLEVAAHLARMADIAWRTTPSVV